MRVIGGVLQVLMWIIAPLTPNTVREMHMPPGSARLCNRAATLTPSP
jgi:hypothetical protein